MFEDNLIGVETPSYILSYSMKWLGENKITTRGLCDFPAYKRNKKNDKFLAREIRDFLHDADIVIAHNGDSFDVKKVNARLAVHSIEPPSPFKSVDTLKAAKKYFKFDSNKLDNIGKALGVGQKLAHTGFDLWKRCMDGDLSAWAEMKEYNERDVVLLELVYKRIRPFMGNHPDLNAYTGKKNCPACQSSKTQSRGIHVSRAKKRTKHQCQDCGHWFIGEVIK